MISLQIYAYLYIVCLISVGLLITVTPERMFRSRLLDNCNESLPGKRFMDKGKILKYICKL